jgi:DNA polymerase III sliding clamp (beta) subunit (PCNA family)
MRRVDLVECVDLVSPALANHDIIPILNHIWLTGSSMMAYNDAIAISTRLKTDFECAIQGNTFTSLVKTLRAEEVNLTEEKDNLRLKAGGVNITFPTMPPSSFIFEMPRPAKDTVGLPEAFFDGIELCLQSAGTDPSKPEQLGVTLVKAEKFVALFGTNDLTFTYVPLTLKDALPIKDRVTLSTEFCKQAVKIAKDKTSKIEINDEYSLLASGNVTLFGKLIETDRPIEFHKIINHNVPQDLKKAAITIPTRLKEMVERAIIISDVASEKNYTTITVTDDRLRMETKSQLRGEMMDSMKLKEHHPEVTLKIDCRNIKSGIDIYDKMLITNKCMILTNARGAIYMVAAMA